MTETVAHASFVEPKVVADHGQPMVYLVANDNEDTESQYESADDELIGQRASQSSVPQEKHDSLLSDALKSPSNSTESPKRSKRQRVKTLGHDAKCKSKRLLDSAKARAGFPQPTPDDSPLAELDNNAAFQPAQLVENEQAAIGGTADKLKGAALATKNAVLHPQRALRRTAATHIAIPDRPYLSEQADIDYLEAHNDLSRAQSSSGLDTDNEDLIEERRSKIEDLDNLRDGKRVAWTTSRHIDRVMVVPKREIAPPDPKDFYKVDDKTGRRHFDWPSYLSARNRAVLKSFALNQMGNVDPASDVPFDKDITMKYVERLIMASAPWQSWFLSIRKIYRWENPNKTRMWFALWFGMWWADYIMTFVLGWVVYIVLENRYKRTGVDTLRESHDRAVGTDNDTVRLNELISRHGSSNWLDPLLEEAGPMIQMQIRDLADFLEILNNFYDWRAPNKTWATLFWFLCAISLGSLTSTQNTMKVIWMFLVFGFFLSKPIASKHPQYRHVVSALMWIFWDIPTDAEWAMMYLRKKAQETRARIIGDRVSSRHEEMLVNPSSPPYAGAMDLPDGSRTEPVDEPDASSDSDGDSWHSADSSTSILGGTDLVSFKCRYSGKPGHLILYSSGLRFVRSSPLGSQRKERWRTTWLELAEVRKTSYSTVAKVIATDGLWLLCADQTVFKLTNVQGRDRAFNCILGFSGLKFVVLQPIEERKEKISSGKVPFDGEDISEGEMGKQGPFD